MRSNRLATSSLILFGTFAIAACDNPTPRALVDASAQGSSLSAPAAPSLVGTPIQPEPATHAMPATPLPDASAEVNRETPIDMPPTLFAGNHTEDVTSNKDNQALKGEDKPQAKDLTATDEKMAMPLAGQANDHSSGALDKDATPKPAS